MATDDTWDDPRRDPAVLDSAMDTGSDEGEPGDRPDESPLTADERALLDRLTHDEGADVVTDAAEDSPETARAVAEGTVVPGAPPAGEPDPDTPQFHDTSGA